MSDFPVQAFQGKLRPSQEAVVAIARAKLAQGHRKLHIVAPPGSGKTVLGLYLWAECLKTPTVVFSPNSAIQSQWGAKTALFSFAGERESAVSIEPQRVEWLTSLTYQSVTLPGRGDADLETQAAALWREKLVASGETHDEAEAETWISDLRAKNPAYFEERAGVYRKQARDLLTLGGESLRTLHPSALALLTRLKERGVGLLIFDECHHLLGHWGRVLADAHAWLGSPVVLGLTATPPDRDGKLEADLQRYDEFFGPIDFEVPVPAVVKDGFLAPYQDLVYFTQPTAEELRFIAQADTRLHELIDELCAETPAVAPHEPARLSLTAWLSEILAERRLPVGVQKDWNAFERRDREFAYAARKFLLDRGCSLPAEVPEINRFAESEFAELDLLTPVLDRYVRHYLRRSPHEVERELAESVADRLRMLGMQITETGTRPCASPVGRVLAYSRAKARALPEVLRAEYAVLGDRIRAVVVSDYEITSAVSAEVEHLLDAEAGGAAAAFKLLTASPEGERLDPILVTGSSIWIDDDSAETVRSAAVEWLAKNGYQVELRLEHQPGFHELIGSGADWRPKVYVALITELFQRGITKCLLGTRGLLGEGWDADKINVLIDLTTVTTSMSINQLRGRSIRLDPQAADKLADNWDIVCLAPQFLKGFDDYKRFQAKHAALYGVTDDATVEKGVGHVHPSLTETKPELLAGSIGGWNEEMLARTRRREETRKLWRIGEPFRGEAIRAVETRMSSSGGAHGFPPFKRSSVPWNDESLMNALGAALLEALRAAKLIGESSTLHVGTRAGGYVRAFLEQAEEAECELFADSLAELLAPLDRPRYVIPRNADFVSDTWLSSFLPEVVGRYFRKRKLKRIMLHAVPSALAKNRETAELFQTAWNRRVGPGEVMYAVRGEGGDTAAAAIESGETPTHPVHKKDLFR